LYLYPQLADNVGYVLHEPATNKLLAFDVGDFKASHKTVTELERRTGAELGYILTTHKHWDHTDGNLSWVKERPNIQVFGSSLQPDEIPGLTHAMNDLETMTIGEFCISCMECPGHTQDHCSFIVTHVAPESTKIPFLFCGDTLFSAGCGRIMDGCTAEQLFYSLQKLMALPQESLMFCGHEYTLNNLKFA